MEVKYTQLVKDIKEDIQSILSANSIIGVTDIELRIKQHLKEFVTLFPYKEEEIVLHYLKKNSLLHKIISYQRCKIEHKNCVYDNDGDLGIDIYILYIALELNQD